MADLRTPRGYGRRHPAYQELMEGERVTLKYLKASRLLPIAEIEAKHDDAIVIPAGTWVGLASHTGGYWAGNTGTSELGYSLSEFSSGNFTLMPAASRAYTLTYSTIDADDTFSLNGLVVDIDTLAAITAGNAAAGASTKVVGDGAFITGGGIKPIGITYQDIYAGGYGVQFNNYERQPVIGFLSANKLIQVPCLSPGEMGINPGDRVAVDGWDQAALTWAPRATPDVTNSVGRLRRVSDLTPGSAYDVTNMRGCLRVATEFVVGRCLRKIRIASGGTVGTQLSTAISAGTITTSSSVNQEFRPAARVQTVPGLGLQGSGTLGLPGHLLKARADAFGQWWALEILVGTY